MINATNIYVQYGDRILLNNVNLVVGTQDKLGLIGRNGAGKSTMLKIIAEYQRPDEGNIARPKESSLGFLHQEMSLPKGKTVLEETLKAFDKIRKMEQRIEFINKEISTRTDYESDAYMDLLNEFSELNDQFGLLGGHTMQADVERVLNGLGFKSSDMNRLTDEFSGGWQMRIELAKMLLSRPDFLLLDEPTNHLDIESIIWLENFLREYPKALIVISHDKEFLNNVTKRTVEIELGRLFDYKASYSKAMVMRAERRALQQSAYDNQQRVIADKERTINRFMAKATKTKMAQSMKKQLDKMERVSLDQEDVAAMNIKFPPAPRSGQVVVEAKKVEKSYGNLLVLDGVDLHIDRGDRVAFVGQNGQGKTTLARILIDELNASGGDIELGHNIHVGYYAQNQADALPSELTVLQAIENASPAEMRPRVRSILGAFMFSGEDVDKKVSVLSGGERARLALACLLLKPINLLVLDEPTNHLDMLSKDVLKLAIQEYDGTLIVVSHDRDFLKDLTNRTVEFRDHQLHNFLGDVNFFLDKRAMDNMRSVELSTKKEKAKPVATKVTVDNEERKSRQRALHKAEKLIDKLETHLEKMETQMADPDFYSSPDADQLTNEYNEVKKQIDQAMEDWEKAQEAWDEIG